jgi:hypothetical protein
MKINLTVEERAFESGVREFLDNKLPADIKDKVLQGSSLQNDDHILWQRLL